MKTVKVAWFVTSYSITIIEWRKKSGDGLFVSDVTTGVPILTFFRGVGREYYVVPSDDGHMDSIGSLFYLTTTSCHFLSVRLSHYRSPLTDPLTRAVE